VPIDWNIAGTGDFNGDRKAMKLFVPFNSCGTNVFGCGLKAVPRVALI
jgi:hypothetical protein